MATNTTSIEQLAVNTVRTLSMDAVQAANSGHPGTPMALAPVAYKLWQDFLNYYPDDPQWPGRDRFVLSCGHASMLLYSLVHLAQVRCVGEDGEPTEELALPLEELKNFRQWGSRTPGHPEYGHTFGVETTTGPLGQGCGNSVGMAMAGRWLSGRYDRPGYRLFDYNVWVLCSDGDLMEGVGCEAASLAGHLRLSNLCWIYDDNKITIEGSTELAFSEDVAKRFQGLSWNVLRVEDANDLQDLGTAYQSALDFDNGPTLIIVRSHIAWGSPNKQDTHGAHGAALGEDEVRLTKEAYGWPADEQFLVPEEVLEHFQSGLGTRGEEKCREWNTLLAKYSEEYPQEAAQISLMLAGELPEGWDEDVPFFEPDAKGMATRKSSGAVLNALAARVPWLIGGSADLAPSTNTLLNFEGAGHFSAKKYAGSNFHWGVREHAMASAVNGMTLCGVRAYGATFFVFSDYLRPAMRLSALMEVPSIFVFTHDSVGVGEDGPTHQPIEQLAACRAIPGLVVMGPGDANEVAEAWKIAVRHRDHPTALVLTRQNVPTLDRDKYAGAEGVAKGGYVLADPEEGEPRVVLIGTGSELSLCVAAHEQLASEGIASRVVSMPCWELFDGQDDDYRNSVLPPAFRARVAVEAGICMGWRGYLGEKGRFVGLHRFGASAPGSLVMEQLGLTTENVVSEAKAAIAAADRT